MGNPSIRAAVNVATQRCLDLAEAGIDPSVANAGDSCDNALAETINGL